jgi:hypothetical protein
MLHDVAIGFDLIQEATEVAACNRLFDLNMEPPVDDDVVIDLTLEEPAACKHNFLNRLHVLRSFS